MKTISKYTINLDTSYINLPASSKVIRFADRQGQLCIWALHETDDEKLKKTFFVYGTGQPIADSHSYIASCAQGPFIWHLFSAS